MADHSVAYGYAETIAKDRSTPAERAPNAFQVGRVTATVVPAPVHGGAGLGIAGSF